jgi:hypothetical protein
MNPKSCPPTARILQAQTTPPNFGDTQFGGVGEYEYPRCSDPSVHSLA